MSDDRSSQRSRRGPPGQPSIADAVGEKLRTVYGDVLSEPVPAELSDLVRRLAKKIKDEGRG
jgi:hypothetical protein